MSRQFDAAEGPPVKMRIPKIVLDIPGCVGTMGLRVPRSPRLTEAIVWRESGGRMDAMEIKAFVHGLRNSLNAAKMNAALLTPMGSAGGHRQAETIDPAALRGLDAALREAEGHLRQFHARMEAEWGSTGAPD